MAAAAAGALERNESPYEDGQGFGKFRKRPFRRTTQTTPYDRPSTAARNAGHGSGGNVENGWLSKLLDPAQRLIASGAHRLFASVFRKRLPPPPPIPLPPLEPAIKQRATDEVQEAILTGPSGAQEAAADGSDTACNISDQHGVTELEQIFKQKTFTRSEIDRLTALLQSRSVDLHVEAEEKKSELITSKADLSQARKEDLPILPVTDNGIESHLLSAPILASKVVDEDVATPAELAKAYMGSRPSKMSPPMLPFRGHSWRESSSSLTNKPFPSDSLTQSIVSRPSGRAGFPVNGFVTPRSRGRSAIYGMARTPYSRVQPTTALQGSGTAIDAFGGPSSSSQSTWENNNYPGSKQRALKWGSSVLENDIGSVGPIRRIRQKSRILPSSGALSIRGIGISSNSDQQPLSTPKPALKGLPSVENDNNSIHHSSLRPVPYESTETALKILQQLDVIVSSREKPPTKLSPSMLRGSALRSLDSIDSSKFLENVQDNRLDVEHATCLPDAQDLVSQKDRFKENGPLKYDLTYDKSASAVNLVDASMRSGVTDASTVDFSAMKAVAGPPQNKQSFQMSAHEDYLDLDDDGATASATLTEGRPKLDATVVGNMTTATKIRASEDPSASSEVNQLAGSIPNKKSAGDTDGHAVAEKNAGFTFQAATFTGMTMQQTVVHSLPTVASEAASIKESHVALPTFSFGEKVVSPKEQNGIVTPFENNIKTAEKVPQFVFTSSSAVVTNLAGPKFNHSSGAQPESSSRLAPEFGTEGLADLDKAERGNALKTSVNSKSAETRISSLPSSSPGIFTFGNPAKSSTPHNGPPASIPSFSSSAPPQTSSSAPTIAIHNISSGATDVTTSSEMATSSGSLSVSASAPAFTAAPNFKYGSSLASTTATSPVSATSEKELAEVKTKEMSLGNLNGSPFAVKSSAISSSGIGLLGGTSSAAVSTGSSLFGDVSPVITKTGSSLFGGTSSVTTSGSSTFTFNAGANTSTAANQSQGAFLFSNGSSASAQTSAAGSGTSSHSMPLQFGSSATSPPFGLSGNTALSSGSSPFSSPTASTLFSAGTSSSNSSTTSSVFGSSWPTSQSPIFGSTSNPSTSSASFTLGASASDFTTSSTSTAFGLSSNGLSGSNFSFSSPAAATQMQPVFANSTRGFPFGSSPSNNNDQMSMEDSMAEDTVQASTPTFSLFGQQPATPLSSGFVFSLTPPSAANQPPSASNQFSASVPSIVKPFQFGGQANVAPPQPFQASGSLEFNAGGTFSLGSGGGDNSSRRIVKVKRRHGRK